MATRQGSSRRREPEPEQRRNRRREPEPERERTSSRSNGRKNEYEDEPGWASAFLRPDNEHPQPKYTGQGMNEDGNPIEVAVWIRRSKSGIKYLRIHIQPPYEADDGGLEDDDEPRDERDDDDDIPF